MENDNVEKENFDDSLAIRISKDELTTFKIKSSRMGFPYQMMIRGIIRAFNEDRIKITPTKHQKESLKIFQE